MYILTKNKKCLLCFGEGGCSQLEVHKNIGGGKNEKFCIIAGGLAIGTYPDEKNAVDELAKILSAIEEGKNSYEVQ